MNQADQALNFHTIFRMARNKMSKYSTESSKTEIYFQATQ